MLTYSYLQGVEPPPRRPATDAVKRRAPSKKLLLNSRENAVGSQTPRAYLLELASAARTTLPTPATYSEWGTPAVFLTDSRRPFRAEIFTVGSDRQPDAATSDSGG